jgi:hypothetical protein
MEDEATSDVNPEPEELPASSRDRETGYWSG